jgi:hypothetical protein
MDLQFAIEIFCQARFGEIIIGGAKASGDQNDVGTFFCFRESGKNFSLLIANGGFPDHLDPGIAQLHTHPL